MNLCMHYFFKKQNKCALRVGKVWFIICQDVKSENLLQTNTTQELLYVNILKMFT